MKEIKKLFPAFYYYVYGKCIQQKNENQNKNQKKNVLEEERFELSTFRMRSEHSTSELHPQLKIS